MLQIRFRTYGYTLLEILVVIAIMAIAGLLAVANFRSFGEDETLKGAALDLQTALRKIQTNATTSIKCGVNQSYFAWNLSLYKDTDGTRKYSTGCELADQGPKTDVSQYTLPANITLERLCGNDLSCSSSASCKFEFDTIAYAITVRFSPLTGVVSFFGGPVTTCFNGVNSMTIVLKNTKTNSTKQVTIEKGGNIYVQ